MLNFLATRARVSPVLIVYSRGLPTGPTDGADVGTTDAGTEGTTLAGTLAGMLGMSDGASVETADDGGGVRAAGCLLSRPGRKSTAAMPRARMAITAIAVSMPSRRPPPPPPSGGPSA